MSPDKPSRQNRVREALGRIYDQQPPYFREYLRRFQEDPTSRVFAPLAEAYRRLGRVDEAIEICREGLEHHPEFHGGRVAFAKCLVDKRDYTNARAQLERVVRAVPENLLAQRLLGEVNLVLNDKEAALHALKMALLLAPQDVALAEKVHGLEREMMAGGGRSRAAPAAPAPVPVDDDLDLEPTKVGVPRPSAYRDDPVDTPATDAALDELLAEAAPEGDGGALWGLDEGQIATQVREVPGRRPEPPAREEAAEADADDFLKNLEEEAADEDIFADAPAPPPDDAVVKFTEDSSLDDLLGHEEEAAEEGFRVEHVSDVFKEGEPGKSSPEITTETLGDLYFSQGQFDKALRIFEKIQGPRKNPELTRKINACRARLGVSREALVRNRQVDVLSRLLNRVRRNG